jgi:uncharacterized protein (UPF0276 family)
VETGDRSGIAQTTSGLPSHSPPKAGIGLKSDHYRAILDRGPQDMWLEVHPENYMVAGGPRLAWLEALRADRALSFHGVGASLGSVGPLCRDHLSKLKTLISRFEPEIISEHVAWAEGGGQYFADLLPMPMRRSSLAVLMAHVDEMQSYLGRRILLENPSTYLRLRHDQDEPEFLVELARRTGCGLLIDVNNVHVRAVNTGFNAEAWIDAIPLDLIYEIHVAGHAIDERLGPSVLIDTHASPVAAPVWKLLDRLLSRVGPKPVLVERDGNIPPFEELLAERNRAQLAIDRVAGSVACTP